MKKLLFIICFFIALNINAQDVVKIVHLNYTTEFSKSNHYPIVVDWWLTKAKLDCTSPLTRTNNFAPDPTLNVETDLNKYYVNSGYDRGHMCDDKDNLCLGVQVQTECFYYSNMSPQWPGLNRGSWKLLENSCRKLALDNDSIHIWCGNLGCAEKLNGVVSVPTQCWKVVYIAKNKTYQAYLFNNLKDDSKNKLDNIRVDKSVIEKLTGLKF